MITEAHLMIAVILILAIVLGAGWRVWPRRGRGRTPAAPGTPAGMPPERLAFEAFTHGNPCLAAGRARDGSAGGRPWQE
jgi:hypothetical protein